MTLEIYGRQRYAAACTLLMDHGKNTDEELNDTLHAWRVETPLPPRFQENVWRRIEIAEHRRQRPSSWTLFLNWLSQIAARPAVAVAYVAVLGVLGLTLGFKQAQDKSAHLGNRLEQRYVQAVDPFQMPRGQ